jgi:virginiamycin A acetyltransferase
MPYTLTVDKTTIFHEGEPHIIDYGGDLTNIKFGKYTSNGRDLTILVGGTEHFYKRVTNCPLPLDERRQAHHKGDIVVGNDVWIGHGVTIFNGVSIGDGAVIGACSVVSKNIPPYAIAVGNPIRVIKYRFDSETIAKLLKIAWWDKGEQFVTENAYLLLDENNVQLFIKRCGL